MFTIEIAGILIEIDNRYDVIENRCKDYIVMPDRKPDISVKTTDELMAATLAVCSEEDLEQYSMGDLEYFSMHEQIYPCLPRFDAAWMHACVVEVDGQGYAFTAPSGYGKTTQAMLWLKYFGSRARIINGDNPIIRFIDGKWSACGTPFGGSEGYQCNVHVPLKGICFLNRSEHNAIVQMDSTMAFSQMIQLNQLHEMLSPENMEPMMKIWEKIAGDIPFYQLYCNQSPEAVKIAYQGMHAEL